MGLQKGAVGWNVAEYDPPGGWGAGWVMGVVPQQRGSLCVLIQSVCAEGSQI